MSTDGEETGNLPGPAGEFQKQICKVRTGNVCGSGSIVGKDDEYTYVLTNAHVAGTRPGKEVTCIFPHLNDQNFSFNIAVAAYSDRIMMDWALLKHRGDIPLEPVQLSIARPSNKLYTAGYPRCRGPYYYTLDVKDSIHGGVVVRWLPNAIGGQSGSAVHDWNSYLQVCLLTWSWGGYGAGQAIASVWEQYIRQAAYGYERPEGLIELNDNRVDDLENGFFSESNSITDYKCIWNHLNEEPTPPPPGEGDPEFAKAVLKRADALEIEVAKLKALANAQLGTGSGSDEEDNGGFIYGLPRP